MADINLKIDLDRGVTHRRHPTGMEVYMYKDDPGIYYNAKGLKLPSAVAAKAGFDVEQYEKARQRKEYLQKAEETILREQSVEAENEVVGEKYGFKIVHLKHGRHQLLDPSGQEVLPDPQPLEMVEQILEDFKPAVAAASTGASKEAVKPGTPSTTPRIPLKGEQHGTA